MFSFLITRSRNAKAAARERRPGAHNLANVRLPCFGALVSNRIPVSKPVAPQRVRQHFLQCRIPESAAGLPRPARLHGHSVRHQSGAASGDESGAHASPDGAPSPAVQMHRAEVVAPRADVPTVHGLVCQVPAYMETWRRPRPGAAPDIFCARKDTRNGSGTGADRRSGVCGCRAGGHSSRGVHAAGEPAHVGPQRPHR